VDYLVFLEFDVAHEHLEREVSGAVHVAQKLVWLVGLDVEQGVLALVHDYLLVVFGFELVFERTDVGRLEF